MSGTAGFLIAIAAAFLLVCLAVGLIISAFVGKPAKAGRVRAAVGGALLIIMLAAYFIFFK